MQKRRVAESAFASARAYYQPSPWWIFDWIRRRFFLRHQNRRGVAFWPPRRRDHGRRRRAPLPRNHEPTTEVAVHTSTAATGQRTTLFFPDMHESSYPSPALASTISAAPRAHRAPPWCSALAPSPFHPRRHDPHRSLQQTIPSQRPGGARHGGQHKPSGSRP